MVEIETMYDEDGQAVIQAAEALKRREDVLVAGKYHMRVECNRELRACVVVENLETGVPHGFKTRWSAVEWVTGVE